LKIVPDIYMVGSGQIRLSNRMDSHVYLIDGEGELALIDAGVGVESERILENVRKEGFDLEQLRSVLVTHGHPDHAGGCRDIQARTGCSIVAPEYEDEVLEGKIDIEESINICKRTGIYPPNYVFPRCQVDRVVSNGRKISIGKYEVTAIMVPGHSKGSTCYLLEQEGCRILFSSDVVFFGGTIGLGNWPGSNLDDYRQNIDRLADLRIDALLPGHFLWTLEAGQEHLDRAIQSLKLAWVPPLWSHQHPLF